MATKKKSIEDVLLLLCNSVKRVLMAATASEIRFSPVVQRIQRTCLKPDIGCFVLFDGCFSGLVIINFSAAAAVELYQRYMRSMGMPEEELAILHTSDEVGNLLSELMNQMVGDFQASMEREMLLSMNQSQPRMLAINKELNISVDSRIDRPQARRVSFQTASHNLFYLEMAMEKTEFVELQAFEKLAKADPDQILDEARGGMARTDAGSDEAGAVDDQALLDQLGL